MNVVGTTSVYTQSLSLIINLPQVRPEWVTMSAKAGVLLPWKNFIFRPGDRPEDSQGTKIAQTSLYDGFTSGSRPCVPASLPDETSLAESDGDEMESSEARQRSPIPFHDSTEDSAPGASTAHQMTVTDPVTHTVAVESSSDIYGASRFGEHEEYMRRKRAKLQIQNSQLEDDSSAIFQGLAIYVSFSFVALMGFSMFTHGR